MYSSSESLDKFQPNFDESLDEMILSSKESCSFLWGNISKIGFKKDIDKMFKILAKGDANLYKLRNIHSSKKR